jgi:uncharacterized protein
MGIVDKHHPGDFCWFELGTTNFEGAEAFYSGLFGWQVERNTMEPGGIYGLPKLQGQGVGGMYELGAEMAGIPPHWIPYIAVEDVDATAARVSELGGRVVMGPFDVMEHGRMIVLQDPSGATINAWQARNHKGAGIVGEPGTVCWSELATRDPEGSRAFYTALVGWEAKPHAGGGEYTEWVNAGRSIGGMLVMGEKFPSQLPPHWMIYFYVESCDESTAKATALGANVHVPPTDIPGVGRFSVIGDPQGAVFAMISMPAETTA